MGILNDTLMDMLKGIQESFRLSSAEAYDGVNISYYSCGGNCEGSCGWSRCQGDCDGTAEGWEGL